MSLTPEAIANIRTSAGLSAVAPPPAQKGSSDILAQRKAALGMTTPDSGGETTPSLGSKISSDISKRGEGVYNDITSTEGNSDNPVVQSLADISHGVHAAGNAFGAITDVGGDLVGSLFKHLGVDTSKGSDQAPGDNPIKGAFQSTGSKAYDELGIRLNDFINKNPEVGKAIESVLRTGQGSGEVASGILTAEGTAEGAQKAVDLTKQGIEKTQEIVGNVKDSITGKVKDIVGPEQNDLEKIKETISPKPTIKQAKLAETEGRLYKGKEPGIFTKGGEDKIAASSQQADSARTIAKNIPGAAGMDEPTLYQALDEKIGEKAQALKPVMESTPIHPDTVEKIGSDWEEVKAAQADNAYMPSDVNVKKLQADFQERIKEIGDKGNMNDLWDARKAYDTSVPTNVKTANDLSSEALQAKKDIWLQNRKILSDAITDTENGMGETAREPFKEMRDMYEGKNGILSKAKVETARAPSKVSKVVKAVKEHPAATALGAIGADKALKATTGIGI